MIKVFGMDAAALHVGQRVSRMTTDEQGTVTATGGLVKVKWDLLRSYSDGSTGNQHVKGTYKLFRDEFHAWVLKTTGDETRVAF